MSLKQSLEWRYATKKFDPAKKLSADQLQHLLDTVHLSPSSYGLQQYKILVVEDAAIREQLRDAAYGQAQLTDSSQVIVFAAETEINEAYVKKYIDHIVEVRGIERSAVADFENVILGAIGRMGEDQKIAWAHKQAYIALGIAMAAASEAGIDNCPMEGFNAGKFDEILGLKEKGLTTSVILCIGHRAEDDHYAHFAKVRKPANELFIHI
ncbi:NAD(P)H-dependent oxidoreductase [Mucilaginibacter sp. Bleaf8]|uniref:NAD(P)H-dependent oxidoreductase n=1 Tax=Mucilaginibacter sp. Bleaf8 TaxID=2834430 RepID=UPI001BCF5E0B|nr:NAD(P)H-dependent oxidoreductase [Mucilaginibacter sp. Bleaf8]MBS7566647.1 NAD(P)H-dependent oxidoreductase [Mucilaginibacter sp. Bleaf8]